MSMVALADFKIKRPKYEIAQDDTINWLISAHTHAEAIKNKLSFQSDKIKKFKQEIENKLKHVGCKSTHIHTRGVSISDYLHTNFDKMELFNLNNNPEGECLDKKVEVFEKITDEAFEHFYPTNDNPPHELIHVSCTGYVAPSSAQKIASKRSWNDQTMITHAYHMGCYGSIPAIRMAVGSLYSPFCEAPSKVDIVHTEICSLHTHPTQHEADQLVAQSLFSDGFIKYSAFLKPPRYKPYLKILAHHEQTIENSTKYMTWNLSNWGFKIFLGKEIPVLISKNIQKFLSSLLHKANLDSACIKGSYFAIHPGGPKIIEQIQKLLDLNDQQVEATKMILKTCGNMSSATLPHIWEHILTSAEYPDNSIIISFAFGPGLTINGTILKKER